ncbi:MAG: hypothetical protein U1D96_05240 [Eubacteriales bacterium]|nr:hypothetical protein [Eubacteriales bacterium]
MIYYEGGDPSTEFYLVDDIVFVAIGKQIVTVYRSEYGFGSEIDRKICDELKQSLAGATQRLKAAETAMEKNVLKACGEIEKIASERRQLELRLKVLQSRENKLTEYQAEQGRALDEVRYEVESYAKKLVYSVTYRLEWANLQRLTG